VCCATSGRARGAASGPELGSSPIPDKESKQVNELIADLAEKADLDARQELYREIAERIWSPSNLMREVEADPVEIATA